jgi:hypothetical protein
VLYKNHDLALDVYRDGTVIFGGRGAFSEGNYGVRFASVDGLSIFLKSQETQLSQAQREWLGWVLTNLHQGGAGATKGQPARAAGDQSGRRTQGPG